MHKLALSICLCWLASTVSAVSNPQSASGLALNGRLVAIATELRCLVCQNQTIADSHAALALDLRAQILEKLEQGQSDQQIIDYMTARYGDFVLYRPPVKPATAVLWFGPGVLLIAGITALVFVLRRRSRLPSEAFEQDEGVES